MTSRIEFIIVEQLVKDSLAAGYQIGVHDGEEFALKSSDDASAIMAALFSVDEERLIYWKDGKGAGWVFLVHGNDGWDVICDYSMSLEHVMKGADKLSDIYANA
jgi:hypothetical protein